jgi:DNA-directed RNA polymerase subunit RPC12/RpoP
VTEGPPPAVGAQQFKCRQCGARLEFAPGADALACPYCGATNEIPKSEARVEELDFEEALAKAEDAAATHEILTVKCRECGAESTLPPDVTSAPCAFCGSGLVTTAESRKAIKPNAVLPFQVTKDAARAAFVKWIAGLWFAPGELKRHAQMEASLTGVYVPYWTFDAETTTDYVGERGEVYYTTETYTETENGQTVTRTREVRHVRWYPASGTVRNSFDDLLVRATSALAPKYLDALEPWDLNHLVAYQDEYLSGFRTDSYQVDLASGFGVAQRMMESAIDESCREDIGGDEQRVESKDTSYADVTFKHVLFPVWISAYRYRGKVYRLLVNARTGEVQGERPWSVAKFLLLAAAAAAAIFAIAFFASRAR